MMRRSLYLKFDRAGKEANEHEQLKKEKRTLERLRYSSEIRRQIMDNETKNKNTKESQFREAEDYRKRVEDQQKMISHLKATKLKDLDLPEKYVKEVARKTNVPWDDLSQR